MQRAKSLHYFSFSCLHLSAHENVLKWLELNSKSCLSWFRNFNWSVQVSSHFYTFDSYFNSLSQWQETQLMFVLCKKLCVIICIKPLDLRLRHPGKFHFIMRSSTEKIAKQKNYCVLCLTARKNVDDGVFVVSGPKVEIKLTTLRSNLRHTRETKKYFIAWCSRHFVLHLENVLLLLA